MIKNGKVSEAFDFHYEFSLHIIYKKCLYLRLVEDMIDFLDISAVRRKRIYATRNFILGNTKSCYVGSFTKQF